MFDKTINFCRTIISTFYRKINGKTAIEREKEEDEEDEE